MSDTKVKSSNLILSALNQAIIPDTNEAYDLGTAEKKFRDLYLSTGTIYMGDNSVSIDADGRLSYSRTVDGATKTSAMPEVDLNIAPEVLGIQVQANDAGDNIMWKWTWTQSSLPYSRIDITNETQLSVPLYNKGTYTIDNYAAHETYDDMTQTHKGYFKWVEGAGTDNLVSWATYTENVSTSISTINDGNSTEVQRYSFTVPDTITLPTLTQPSGIGYDVSFSTTGAYTFGANASSGTDMDSVAEGDNPTLGPLYRGSTYTFNLDSSLASHPFYLTTDNGRNFVSGNYVGEYTDGVTGSRNDGGVGRETLTFTVPSDAPDELYYQCAFHSAMRGAITIKDLEVKENDNGNYVVYFQHTHEGHATEVELRPIPSLVNQMCLVYDSSTGKFVPQDLATYVENTPSFKRKIRDVSGTAELVVADGSTVIAKVNVYPDSTYLPLTNINQGDQAFATDTNILYIWDGSDWQQAGASNSDDLTEGSTNIFYTNTRVDNRVDTLLGSGGSIKSAIDTAVSNLISSAPGALDTLDELAAAIGDDANFATTVTNSIATKADKTRTISAGTGLTGGGDLTANRTLSLGTSGVNAGTYGSASAVPVLTIDTYGRITSATTTAVAGVSSVSYTASTGVLTINTSNGSTYTNDLGIGTGDSPTFAGLTLTGDIAVNGGDITSSTGAISFGNENLSTTGTLASGALTVTGNISVSGTVDGRDIASDGSKLDGIESGATADQTASEILTLIKTVDGIGSGLDADRLDGYEASAFALVGSGQTYTGNQSFSGNVSVTGTTTTTALNIGSDSIAEYIADTVGSMVSSNTESGISVVYQDADNTLDFSLTADPVITLSGDVSGSATMTNLGSTTITTTVANDSHNHSSSSGNFTVGGDLTVSGGVITLANLELTENPPAYSIWMDANDTYAPATLGNYVGSYPHGVFVNGDNGESSTTLGSGTVQLYHTGHFSGTNISNWQTAYGWGNHANGGYATLSGANSFTNSYNEFGNSTGSVSNDGSWNARVNVAGSSHARLDVKSVSDGIITTVYSHTGQNAGKVGTMSNHRLGLMTNGNEQAVLTTGGNFGIGTTTPNNQLEIYKDAEGDYSFVRLNRRGGGDLDLERSFIEFVFTDDNANNYPQVKIGAEVGVGDGSANQTTKEGSGAFIVYCNHATDSVAGTTSGMAERFRVNSDGDAIATGDFTANSDRRIKENIEPISDALNKVKAINGVTFNKLDDERRHVGVIAQEVEEVLPEAVTTGNDEMGTKSVAYGNMVGLLIEAIKEQQEQIDELKRLLEAK